MGKEFGKKDPRRKPYIEQARIAFENEGLWNTITTKGEPLDDKEKCEKNCKFFQAVSGPKYRSGRYGPDEGKCRASNNEKVIWGFSNCLDPDSKEYKRQGS